MNLRVIRIALWGLVGLALVAGTYFYLRPVPNRPPEQVQLTLGAPFVLTDQEGRKFDSRSLDGTPYVMFFGFTHCPDVCPNTLARLARLRAMLGDSGKDLRILFVTVDPERDTPAELAEYARLFGTPVTALTGSLTEIADVTRSFGIYARKAPATGGDYSVDHSSQVLLFDGDGRFGGTIALEEGDGPALQKLKNLTV